MLAPRIVATSGTVLLFFALMGTILLRNGSTHSNERELGRGVQSAAFVLGIPWVLLSTAVAIRYWRKIGWGFRALFIIGLLFFGAVYATTIVAIRRGY